MTSCVIYCRVSTEQQGESGLGLEAQSAACTSYAQNQGWEHTICTEVASGSAPLAQRCGLQRAISLLDGNSCVLLVAKRDRLSRGDVMATAMIEAAVKRAGARVVSVAGEGTEDDSPVSVLMRRIIDAFGEYERLLIGLRTSAALRARYGRGQPATKEMPYGYGVNETDGVFRVDAEQAVIVSARMLREQGSSLRGVCQYLNGEGLRTRSGSKWHPELVSRICKPLRERSPALWSHLNNHT